MLWHYTTTIHLLVVIPGANNGCLSAAYENTFTFRCILWSASELWLKACVSKPSSPLHSSSSLWRVSISGLWFSGGRGEEEEQGSGWVCSSGQDGTATVEALWEERAAFRFSANKERDSSITMHAVVYWGTQKLVIFLKSTVKSSSWSMLCL